MKEAVTALVVVLLGVLVALGLLTQPTHGQDITPIIGDPWTHVARTPLPDVLLPELHHD